MIMADNILEETDYHISEEAADLNIFGMWVFLVSEVMFFGGVFLAYLIYRWGYPEIFAQASSRLDVLIGTVNTALLLTSSFTMALAVNAAQRFQRKRIILFLLITILLAVSFLGIKGYEWYTEIEHGYYPGDFNWPEPAGVQPARAFFSLYFAMTGIHALHMLIGVLLMLTLVGWTWWKKQAPRNFAPIEMTGLYWHFVDVVWIFLFPLLYLIDRT